uniref:Uncharacterized protein n=1 Tax=Arundo donax TaxID=35708 RepID=A0A0A8Y6M9_ARUDO
MPFAAMDREMANRSPAPPRLRLIGLVEDPMDGEAAMAATASPA